MGGGGRLRQDMLGRAGKGWQGSPTPALAQVGWGGNVALLCSYWRLSSISSAYLDGGEVTVGEGSAER